jgi:hypothetical protein
MTDLYLRSRVRPDAVEMGLVGWLTARTTTRLRQALEPHRSVVCRVRLRDCTGIDLDGVFALLVADMEAGEAGGAVRLFDVPPLVERYLRQHHAGHLLDPVVPAR